MIVIPLEGAWQFRTAGKGEWLPATVPGCNFTDLLALGRIQDPFVADNEEKVAWVYESDWEYRRTFRVDDEDMLYCDRIALECDGLDTIAEVLINGQPAGANDNMFRPCRFDVKKLLRAGGNEILVRFTSPLKFARQFKDREPVHQVNQSLEGAPWVRKAQCQFGWDWGPRLAPSGIWRGLRLVGRNAVRLADVRITQRHTARGVTVVVTAEIERFAKDPVELSVRLESPNGSTDSISTEVGNRKRVSLNFDIAQPELWWPNGYGAQPLYGVNVELLDELGGMLDEQRRRIGLRTIRLEQKKDRFGQSFTFVVNGVRIFAKGANWIPADSFPNRVTPERYRDLLGAAARAHMNMLRVWGGGFYEEETFYDLCDELGLLVWQDFMFACGIYPTNAEFVENFRTEAIANLRRLRHRACLALWCGNNEMEQGWVDWGWGQRFPASCRDGYDRLFHKLLPEWVKAEDPVTPYWPSSASSGTPFKEPNAEHRGDGHYWVVWHGNKPFTEYRKHYFRFQSEFGFQSLPAFETVQTFATPADQNMTSRIMEHHQRSGGGNGRIVFHLTDNFRMPRNFEMMCYLSQLLQAEAIRYGVEHWRRNCHRVSGALYWQLNDCWPVCSWSSVDYFHRWKALHYAAQRFFAPVLISAREEGVRAEFHVTNDRREPFDGRLTWQLETVSGEPLQSGAARVKAPAGRDVCVKELDFGRVLTPELRRKSVLVYGLADAKGQVVSQGVVAFAPSKHLDLTDPGLQAELSDAGECWRVCVRARSLARFVVVKLEGVDAVWDDNYFDLPVGRERVVTTPKRGAETVAQARARLRVFSLWDSFTG